MVLRTLGASSFSFIDFSSNEIILVGESMIPFTPV